MEEINSADSSKVQITMLGSFEIRRGDKAIGDNISRTHKIWNLLEYLITFRDKDLSQNDLISALWPDDSSDNPANALKNLIYRIRTTLAASGIQTDEEFVTYRRGSYCWNKEIDCQIDVSLFENLCKEAQEAGLEEEAQIQKCLQAVDIYKGDFLPKSSFEEWVVPVSTYYHTLYLNAVHRLLDLLMDRRDYQKVVEVCEKAIIIDRFDEKLHEQLILAFYNVGWQQKALEHYDYITNLFYRELGVKVSDRLRSIYRDIIKTEKSVETDLDIIKNDLREATSVEGAFFCEYEIFKDVYRLQARSIARNGQTVYIGLLTVTDFNSGIPDPKLLNNAMDHLEGAIRLSLRKGDVAARFSAAQYVVLLPTVTFESGSKVLERIIKRFSREHRNIPVIIHTKLQPLDPIPL